MISRLPDIRRSKGGIWFPDQSFVQHTIARVLLHEPSDWWDYPALTGLDVVILKWAEREFTLDGVDFQVIDEQNILAVLTPDGEDFEPLPLEAFGDDTTEKDTEQ